MKSVSNGAGQVLAVLYAALYAVSVTPHRTT